ncbi:hypothetical protein F7725_012051 [Dissostichus mawsoni]|uniref:Uncharacterized protein n=1 Tax=Dissostichus mawsoni TaxID=36200 RepID=A0A7J5ZBA7_DISMA|nr:hypothetical protein F7725_012051 [Dissostichus mawsoni]
MEGGDPGRGGLLFLHLRLRGQVEENFQALQIDQLEHLWTAARTEWTLGGRDRLGRVTGICRYIRLRGQVEENFQALQIDPFEQLDHLRTEWTLGGLDSLGWGPRNLQLHQMQQLPVWAGLLFLHPLRGQVEEDFQMLQIEHIQLEHLWTEWTLGDQDTLGWGHRDLLLQCVRVSLVSSPGLPSGLRSRGRIRVTLRGNLCWTVSPPSPPALGAAEGGSRVAVAGLPGAEQLKTPLNPAPHLLHLQVGTVDQPLGAAQAEALLHILKLLRQALPCR